MIRGGGKDAIHLLSRKAIVFRKSKKGILWRGGKEQVSKIEKGL